jgi:hypothetical protein
MKVSWAYSASRDQERATAASRIGKRSVTAGRADFRAGDVSIAKSKDATGSFQWISISQPKSKSLRFKAQFLHPGPDENRKRCLDCHVNQLHVSADSWLVRSVCPFGRIPLAWRPPCYGAQVLELSRVLQCCLTVCLGQLYLEVVKAPPYCRPRRAALSYRVSALPGQSLKIAPQPCRL